MFKLRAASSVAIVAYALVLAIYACRVWWVAQPGQAFWADDTLSNYLRFADFHASLKAGYLFPQWSTFVRGGLGEPQFTFYQPGLFYVGSIFVPSAIGLAIAFGRRRWPPLILTDRPR